MRAIRALKGSVEMEAVSLSGEVTNAMGLAGPHFQKGVAQGADETLTMPEVLAGNLR